MHRPSDTAACLPPACCLQEAAEEQEKQDAAKTVSDGAERDVEMGRVTAARLPLVAATGGRRRGGHSGRDRLVQGAPCRLRAAALQLSTLCAVCALCPLVLAAWLGQHALAPLPQAPPSRSSLKNACSRRSLATDANWAGGALGGAAAGPRLAGRQGAPHGGARIQGQVVRWRGGCSPQNRMCTRFLPSACCRLA